MSNRSVDTVHEPAHKPKGRWANTVMLLALVSLVILALVFGLVGRLSRGVNPPSVTLGVGFESVTDDEVDWQHIRQRMDAAGVDGATISVGRGDFMGIPVAGQEQYWAGGIDASADRVGDIVDTLRKDSDRRIGLTVDVLAPRIVGQHDTYKARFADGSEAVDFPSALALHDGEVGERVVAMCGEAARRYKPDYIALTELIGDAFFSEADEDLYRSMTGEPGFPRDQQGNIRVADSTLNNWQSEIITDVIQRCQNTAGIAVEMDARVNWDDPGTNRFDSGHRYEDILGTGADLALWVYTGLAHVSPTVTHDVAAKLKDRFDNRERERITLTVGLWGDMSHRDVKQALRSGEGFDMSLTPMSMMDDKHWEILERL